MQGRRDPASFPSLRGYPKLPYRHPDAGAAQADAGSRMSGTGGSFPRACQGLAACWPWLGTWCPVKSARCHLSDFSSASSPLPGILLPRVPTPQIFRGVQSHEQERVSRFSGWHPECLPSCMADSGGAGLPGRGPADDGDCPDGPRECGTCDGPSGAWAPRPRCAGGSLARCRQRCLHRSAAAWRSQSGRLYRPGTEPRSAG